jgi:methionyl aminopeptidase
VIIKTTEEFNKLKAAGAVVHEALQKMKDAVQPGISTADLNQIGAEVLVKHGAISAPPMVYGYPAEVCISINHEALHGIPSTTRMLKDGDLLKLDLVASLDGWFADAAISLVVRGNTQDLEDCLLIYAAEEAFQKAMDIIRPGFSVSYVGAAIERVAKKYGFNVLHNFGGHGIGQTIHEHPPIPNCEVPELRSILLEEGQVITIEPIIVAGDGAYSTLPDGWTIVTQDGRRTSHYEHTLVVYSTGPVIVTN